MHLLVAAFTALSCSDTSIWSLAADRERHLDTWPIERKVLAC